MPETARAACLHFILLIYCICKENRRDIRAARTPTSCPAFSPPAALEFFRNFIFSARQEPTLIDCASVKNGRAFLFQLAGKNNKPAVAEIIEARRIYRAAVARARSSGHLSKNRSPGETTPSSRKFARRCLHTGRPELGLASSTIARRISLRYFTARPCRTTCRGPAKSSRKVRQSRDSARRNFSRGCSGGPAPRDSRRLIARDALNKVMVNK